MYFKIRDDIIYRMYKNYGYITDNSLFGYKSKSQMNKLYPGEAYISESGYIILNALTKKPQHIDDIVKKILYVFENVTYDELKQDTIEFLDDLEKDGFLCKGETYKACEEKFRKGIVEKNVNNIVSRSDIKKDMAGDNQLKSLHIEVSNICNEKCVHCYLTQDKTNRLMEEKLFYKIAEDARNANVINITLSGGEPLVHHKISSFLSKCRNLDFSVNVLSNLTLLDDKIIREMKKNPLLSVQTSLYSMNADIHDSITHKKGSFEKTINNLIKLSKSGIPVQISCPIIKQNKESFTDVIKWGENNGIDVIYDFVIFGSVDHSGLNLVNRLSLKEIEEAFDKVIKGRVSKPAI